MRKVQVVITSTEADIYAQFTGTIDGPRARSYGQRNLQIVQFNGNKRLGTPSLLVERRPTGQQVPLIAIRRSVREVITRVICS
jgi:hypothetical protein